MLKARFVFFEVANRCQSYFFRDPVLKHLNKFGSQLELSNSSQLPGTSVTLLVHTMSKMQLDYQAMVHRNMLRAQAE